MYSQHEPPVNLVMFTIILTWECITLSKWVLPQLCMEYSHLYMGLHGLYTNMYYKPLTIWFVGCTSKYNIDMAVHSGCQNDAMPVGCQSFWHDARSSLWCESCGSSTEHYHQGLRSTDWKETWKDFHVCVCVTCLCKNKR